MLKGKRLFIESQSLSQLGLIVEQTKGIPKVQQERNGYLIPRLGFKEKLETMT